ncbi:hypothetical protein CY652_01055 [Burkholderia sp. WAC0059]|uniref:MMPL family transporter n=1 Tax=Burkholderia sp. WAC0059 TaxID=2066022 RepID=UPI000C7F334D|nr:MMPL family transporter [Burkholderia sp. WAC0059]PLZ04294.1 hypothetical protein CY652_01055 [Burkholderia sp. WAC0059]
MTHAGKRPATRHAWRIGLAWLLLALVAGGYCAWRFAHGSPLQTNLLALLPATETDPVAAKATGLLASALDERAVFVVTGSDDARTKAAAKRFGAALAASGAFRSVTAALPPFDVARIVSFYLPYRFGLLTAADRAALAAGPDAWRAALMQRLYSPLYGPLATGLGDDPFGWLAHWLAGLPLATSALQIEDGLLVAHRGATTSVLVLATLPGSAYDTKVQRAIDAALARGETALAQVSPRATLARTGAVFYAEAARRTSEREMHLIGIVSACGIALLMLWVFRSPWLIALGFVSTALGVLCAFAATLFVFGQLHLLTLVFGASLIGEAVDYSIQYFVVYLGHDERWQPWQGAREVRPALTVALLTSLLGYAVLMAVPFPALRQIACFAMVGIVAAFASVLSLLPALLTRAPKRQPRQLFARAAAGLARWRAALRGRRAVLLAAVVVALAAPGWLRLASDDDVHLLIQRDASLAAQEATVRSTIGVDDSGQFFVVRGATPERVLERAEALGAKLDALVGAGRLGGWQSVTSFVPSAARQAADRALLARTVFADRGALRALLVRSGFRDDVANAWLAAFADPHRAVLTLDAWLATPWSGPFRHLWLGAPAGAQNGYAAVVMPQRIGAGALPALAGLARGSPGVRFVDQAGSVSRLFGRYRVESGRWLAGVLALVFGLLARRYGWRGALPVILPVLLAIGVALAAFGYAGVPLNLFNWLALMLVLGVGTNYAVFLREGCLRRDADIGAVWTGVLLSAATTTLSFGLLGASPMPALRSFGATLTLGIVTAALLAPMGMPAETERTA